MTTPANIQTVIVSGIIHSEEYRRIVIPHLKSEYFESSEHKIVFENFKNLYEQYNKPPTKDAIEIEFAGSKNYSEDMYKTCLQLVDKVYSDKAKTAVEKSSIEWMVKSTETYCRDRSVYNGIMKSIDIIDGTDKKQSKDGIPKILQDALSICFDTSIGHDFFEDAERRFEYYHRKEVKIKTPLSMINHVTKGGFQKKAIHIIVAPTGVGKTHVKTFFASKFLQQGLNVLYVTLEMAEEMISKRIDSCLLDISMDDLDKLPRDTFTKKINKIRESTKGNLFVKEYPTGSINSNTLRFLIDEFRIKKGITIDVLVVDYLNLLASSRLKGGESYERVKAVTEELRSVAQEKNLCVLTSTQTNRSGQTASDFDLTEVGESHGISATADFMIGCIVTEELEKMDQMRIKLLKNRYGSKSNPSSFIVGMNREKMTLFDVDSISNLPENNVVKFNTNKEVPNGKPGKRGGLIV